MILLAVAALLAGYQLGCHDAYNRVFDAIHDWADRRQGRAARWAVQPVYALLIAVGFTTHPIRWTGNIRANRARLRAAAQPIHVADLRQEQQ